MARLEQRRTLELSSSVAQANILLLVAEALDEWWHQEDSVHNQGKQNRVEPVIGGSADDEREDYSEWVPELSRSHE
jgi:hypothetical protein